MRALTCFVIVDFKLKEFGRWGWEDSPADKVPVVHAWGPKFDPQHTCKKAG